jgi:cytochrome P450
MAGLPVRGDQLLSLPRSVRQPLGAVLKELPGADAKLLAFVLSPSVRANPWRLYRQARESYPVHRTAFGAWTVARHRDVAALARHPQLGVDENKATPLFDDPDGPFTELFAQTMLFRDPPDHERLRRLVARAFTPRQIEDLRTRVEALADQRLDAIGPRGHADLLSEFAYPLPVDVICELLGIPEADRYRFPRWARALAARLDLQPMRDATLNQRGDAAIVELSAYLEGPLTDRKRRLEGGLIDGLVEAGDGDRLSHQELISTCALLLVAGHETTANLIGNGLYALLRHPEQLHELRERNVPIATAVEELLRFDSPVQITQRIALADVELDGTTIPAGALIVLLIGAANRDPDVFDDPDSLDLFRSPNPHLAFSTGIHTCLGATLARLEAGVALERLLDRLTGLRLARRPRWRDTFVLRGLKSLDVSWAT